MQAVKWQRLFQSINGTQQKCSNIHSYRIQAFFIDILAYFRAIILLLWCDRIIQDAFFHMHSHLLLRHNNVNKNVKSTVPQPQYKYHHYQFDIKARSRAGSK